MIHPNVLEALNDQIRHEFNSAYIYLAVSAYCERINLLGFAHWMRLQSSEEVVHAMKLYDFINDRGEVVKLQAIDAPGVDFGTPLSMAEKALAHEKKISGLIDRLYGLAVQEHDYSTQVLLQWFISEQVEEEKNAGLLVDRLKMAGADQASILLLDLELAKRAA